MLTLGSCANVMAKIAQLMPSVLEQMYIAEDDVAKYSVVLEADRRMRQLMGALPGVLLRPQDPSVEPKHTWLSTARRTLAISAADKVYLTARSHPIVWFADGCLTDHHDTPTFSVGELPVAFVSVHAKDLCLRRNDDTSGARTCGSRRKMHAALGAFGFRSHCCCGAVLEHDIRRWTRRSKQLQSGGTATIDPKGPR
jgi:hypothetical protein